mgnify:CR=1 FL=1
MAQSKQSSTRTKKSTSWRKRLIDIFPFSQAQEDFFRYYEKGYNLVLSGARTFELVNVDWKFPYHIVHLNRQSGALIIPARTYHRSISGEGGSIVINQAIRDDEFDPEKEFVPVSSGQNTELYNILAHEKPVIHNIGE